MLVVESLESLLKAKTGKEIKDSFHSLSKKEKEQTLFKRAMIQEMGSFKDAIELIETSLSKEELKSLWYSIMEKISQSETLSNIFHPITKERDLVEIKHYALDTLFKYILAEMNEDQLNKSLEKIVPGFMAESINDVLKPKPQKEIDDELEKLFNISKISEKIEKSKQKNIICLYIYENDWSSNTYYNASKTDLLLKKLIEWAVSAYQHNWRRRFVVYALNPTVEGAGMIGTFNDEGNTIQGLDGVDILCYLEIRGEDDRGERISLDIW